MYSSQAVEGLGDLTSREFGEQKGDLKVSDATLSVLLGTFLKNVEERKGKGGVARD
jgi:hypothetical protein